MNSSPKYFGKEECSIIYCKLIDMARNKCNSIYYDPIAEIMGKSSGESMRSRRNWVIETGDLLGEICDFEHSNDRPMLSALVVNKTGKNKGLPGDGFFKKAIQLGRLKPGQDEKAFWEQELQAVYDAWK